jgi:hypothetical protein
MFLVKKLAKVNNRDLNDFRNKVSSDEKLINLPLLIIIIIFVAFNLFLFKN